MQKTLIIEPQWKRKQKIIITAEFSRDKKEQKEVEEMVALSLWKFWLFNS